MISILSKPIYGLCITALCLLVYSCDQNGGDSDDQDSVTPVVTNEITNLSSNFNADSAWAYIEKQVQFGPRVPGTDPHAACAVWLQEKLGSWADELILQDGIVSTWDKKTFDLKNIIASFNPERKRRIVFFAHWDTRPFADQDDENSDQPFDGANDGGSGVGVLMELARNLKDNPVKMGIDIILFDLEDYGNSSIEDSYCLGSQYWANSLHKPGYSADYGILLDMVGGRNARFSKEGISMYYAPHVVEKIWKEATSLGFSNWFVYNSEPYPTLVDDHLYVNKISGIPTIDIIEYDKDTPKGFGSFWHTHDDNMEIIDKGTLRAVGQTLLSLIYKEDRGAI